MTDSRDKASKAVTAALLATILALSVSAQSQTITGKVVGVSDGDRANHRQPRQRDLPSAELPELLKGR